MSDEAISSPYFMGKLIGIFAQKRHEPPYIFHVPCIGSRSGFISVLNRSAALAI
jgi:hypothetical protein